jgi:hypothetical protein
MQPTNRKGFAARIAQRLYDRAIFIAMALYTGLIGVLWATFAASFS